MNNGPRVLILDIETAPILGYVWGLWDQTVGLNQIKSDWYIISWSAKWLGDKKVIQQDQRNAKDIENDSQLIKGMWKLLDEADIVVTQNGKQFDCKKLNARFVINGMKPPSSYKQIDTRVLAKKHFGFTSNKLEYMTDKLCTKYKKLKHTAFQGFELWSECLKGNKKAWKEMAKYNIYDVLSLEELYTKLVPWDNAVNFNVYHEDPTCSCGSKEFRKNGYFYSATGKYQRYSCSKCHSEFRERKKEPSNLTRVGTSR